MEQLIEHSNRLSEREVQKISLSALRSYYRFRVKAGTPELISDVRGTGGIIADVQYSFPKDDGTRFMATLEATALDSKEEVYFRKQKPLLLFDSLAFGSFVTSITFLILHILKKELVVRYEIFTVIVMLLVTILCVSGFFYLILQNNRRYRYIYAIEQFKQYHADEQWIAVSEEVFENRGKDFLELREQCTRYGFGLIQIDKDRKPQLIITPAREEVFENRRQTINFYTPKQLKRLQEGGAQFAAQLKNIVGNLPLPAQLQQIKVSIPLPTQPLQIPQVKKGIEQIKKMSAPLNPSDPAYLFRFRRSYQNQAVIMGFAMAMVVSVFVRELPHRPRRFVSQAQYTKEVLAAKAERQADPPFVLDMMNVFDTIYLEPIDTTVTPYMEWIRLEHMLAADFQQKVADQLLRELYFDTQELYDCQQFVKLQLPKFMVVEGVYPNFERASNRLNQLMAQKMDVNLLWTRCLDARSNEYILYFEALQSTRSQAETLAQEKQKMLDNLQINTKLRVLVLTRSSGAKIETLNVR